MTCTTNLHRQIRIRDVLGAAEMVVFPALVAVLMYQLHPVVWGYLDHLHATSATTAMATLSGVAHLLIIIGLAAWAVLCTIRYETEVLGWIMYRHEPASRQPIYERADDSRRLTIVNIISAGARIAALVVGSLSFLPGIILIFEVIDQLLGALART